ncbi:MAG: isochorismatase family cysteine hydrolase [Pseudomonadota bacterium]
MALRGFETGRRVALLISECQRGVVEEGLSPFPTLAAQVTQRGIIGKMAHLADAFRAAGLPVFHLHVAHRPDYADVPVNNVILARSVKHGRMKLGSEDAASVDALPVHPSDVLHARSFSLVAFHGTDLDQQLRNRGISTVVLCGVSSNVAIPGSALCASDLGYQVVVPEDCIAGATAETHAFSVTQSLPLYSTVSDSAAVLAALDNLRG